MKRFISMSAALMLSIASAAHADTVATASLSNFQIQLVDLDPTDGITPWINFDVVSGSAALIQPSMYGPDTIFNSSGEAFGDVAANYGNGTASISGDPMAGGLTASAYSAAGMNSLISAHALLGDAGKVTNFTLSANTELIITGVASVTAAASGDMMQQASASWEVMLSGLDGVYSSKNDLHNVATATGDMMSPYAHPAAQSFGGPGAQSFMVSLTNDTQSSTFGNFYGVVDTSAFTFAATPSVPEPTTTGLMLVGLGLFSALRHRRAR